MEPYCFFAYLFAGLGAVVGSYCGYLFSQVQPDGLGYLSMLTTVFLGIKFLVRLVTGGGDVASPSGDGAKKKTALAMRWAAGSAGCAALRAAAAVF